MEIPLISSDPTRPTIALLPLHLCSSPFITLPLENRPAVGPKYDKIHFYTSSPDDPMASRDLKLYKKLHIDTSNLCYIIHYSIYNMLAMMSPGVLLKTSKNGQF